ncbi:MAG: hypothetical protein DRQ55_12425 [Planctomycetota bacterium]|nr:MAG: hypothetical protein DRQ55_12425 [Planctomycetota bacterium]
MIIAVQTAFTRSVLPLLALLSASLPLAAQAELSRYGGDTTRPAPLRAKPALTQVTSEHLPGVIELKFAHDSGVRLADGLFVRGGALLHDVNAALASRGATPRRMFAQSEAWLDAWRQSGEQRSGIALHDLNLFCFVDVAAGQPVGALCDELNALPLVSLAWPAPRGGDPLLSVGGGGDAGATPDFTGSQSYREAAPLGVDADYGNSFSGGRGEGITVADCETGWTDDHEDVAASLAGQHVGFTPAPYPWDHGTAVMGELFGGDNGFGVRGICHAADGLMSTHSPVGGPQNIPGAVANGAAAVGPGDALVIEIQCYGSPPGPFPCEYDPAMFATLQTATANGIHVFAAAGNGSHDLDAPAYGGAFDLSVQDSGAVLVGASDGGALSKASFSNYGSRLTSQGWGFSVTTTGYGSLQSGAATQEYSDDFSGTSSATPIVTGAGVILASMHRAAFGADIDPLALRALLASTGTPQQGLQIIGSRPDVRAAVRALGIPEIELSGSWVPGGTLSVTSRGQAGDGYLLFWAPAVLATPLPLPPWGYLSLDPVALVQLPSGAVLGPGGTAVDSYHIPSNSSLSGLVTYFQGAQAFATQSGTGSLSNLSAWTFP